MRAVSNTVLVAPDSFKGTITATDVAAAVGRGLTAAGLEVDLCPVADGGEGTLDAMAEGLGAELRPARVSDPLGRPVEAQFGLCAGAGPRGRTVAIVETAAASGLHLVAPSERNPVAASTRGTGELIVAARDAGAELIYLGVGGSATTDGGQGAIEAISEAGGLGGVKLVVLCDVRTRFVAAATVFAAQKGADAVTVAALERRLDALAASLPRDPREEPMTGAAGGLSGGLWAAFGAELVPGAAFILDLLDFDVRMRAARAVVTGEGKLDQQSLAGKLISEISTRARQSGVPCHAVVGRRELDDFGARVLDLQAIIEAGDIEALEAAGPRLAEAIGVA